MQAIAQTDAKGDLIFQQGDDRLFLGSTLQRWPLGMGKPRFEQHTSGRSINRSAK